MKDQEVFIPHQELHIIQVGDPLTSGPGQVKCLHRDSTLPISDSKSTMENSFHILGSSMPSGILIDSLNGGVVSVALCQLR